MSGIRTEEQFTWTPANVEALSSLYGDGHSYTEIAARLGHGLTRNACCGKIARLGLRRPPAVNLANKSANGQRNILVAMAEQARLRAETPKKPKPPRAPLVRKRVDSRGGGRVATMAAQAVARTILAPPPPPEPRPELRPLVASLLDPQPHHCRWPIGDQAFAFCGRQKIEGRPYCEHHHQRSVSAVATRKWDSHGRRRAA